MMRWDSSKLPFLFVLHSILLVEWHKKFNWIGKKYSLQFQNFINYLTNYGNWIYYLIQSILSGQVNYHYSSWDSGRKFFGFLKLPKVQILSLSLHLAHQYSENDNNSTSNLRKPLLPWKQHQQLLQIMDFQLLIEKLFSLF